MRDISGSKSSHACSRRSKNAQIHPLENPMSQNFLISSFPNFSFFLRMVRQFFLVRPHSNIFCASECYWPSIRGVYFNKNDRKIFIFKLDNLEINSWIELCSKPVFEFFITNFFFSWLKFCPLITCVPVSIPKTR